MMSELGKTYESVCSEDGKENLNQPYMWLGVSDLGGEGVWRRRIGSGEDGEEGGEEGEEIRYENWDDNEGREGDTCARMLGNGKREIGT